MRVAFVVMFLAICGFAQEQGTVEFPAACGPRKINFEVKRDKSSHAPAQAEAGKALVYFIQDMGVTNCLGSCLTTKVGLDGNWVGANQDNSYFSLSVDPGEHRICANRQSRIEWLAQMVAVAHFNAEAGKTYYFRTRTYETKNQAFTDLDPIDSDQGQYLVSSYALGVSHAKP